MPLRRIMQDRVLRRAFCGLAAMVCASLLAGCASFSNPVGQGIPAHRLPPEYLAPPKEDLRDVPLTALRQNAPEFHLVEKGDVLGVYIEGLVGEVGQVPPVQLPSQNNQLPSMGFPIVVNDDGELPLPQIPPLKVKGMTITEVRKTIVKTLIDRKIIAEGKEPGTPAKQVLVSLLRPRHYRVQVVRQDSALTAGNVLGNPLGNNKRGTGQVVELPAYENDVLNALTRTGGLPGLDAINEVIVQRGDPFRPGDEKNPSQVLHLPMRIRVGESIPFRPDDVILKTGDIIFIKARDTEVFYVGGIMSPHQFVLPRDYDLTVVDAVALAGGPLVSGGIQQNNLEGNVLPPGIGSPSPSAVTVLRRTKDNGQISIRVDLNKALNDRRENLIVQSNDVLILQETLGESMTRYLTSIYHYNFLNTIVNSPHLFGTQSAIGP